MAKLGPLDKKLPDCELLKALQVIEFDPESRYLVVARPKERLSLEAHERIGVHLKHVLNQLLENIKFSVIIAESDVELSFYQFKEKSTDG